jgi:TolB protein
MTGLAFALLGFLAQPAAAPATAPPIPPSGLVGTVVGDQFTLFRVAVPNALNRGGVPDTRGITEALSGTVQRDLKIAAYFDLVDPQAFLVDPAKEGLEPNFRAWFNVGAQGLVKIAYEVSGSEVTVDCRLFTVDRAQRVPLPAPFDKSVRLPLDTDKLRVHAHGFANEIVKYYTGEDGFFLTRIVATKRTGKGTKDLFMLAPDGGDETQLTNNGSINMLPSFRGGRILFTSFKNGNPDLFVLEKGASRSLSSSPGLNTGGQLSPDGSTVALTLSKDGSPDIFLISPSDGRVIKKLTDSDGIDTSPSWSPDGSRIAFVSDRHGSPQVWVMDKDGGNQKRLTFQGEYNQTPEWSPRGDKLLFTARDERLVFDIFTVEVGTGVIARITQNQGNNEEPDWSPNGRYMVFSSTRSGEAKLFIATEDGRVQTPITQGKGEYLTPTWGR